MVRLIVNYILNVEQINRNRVCQIIYGFHIKFLEVLKRSEARRKYFR